MDGLFWNKIAGAILGTALALFGLKEIAHIIYHPHGLDEPAFLIDLPDGPGPGPDVVEGPVDFGALLAVADISAGEKVARKCVSCHTFDQGGNTMTGPNLYDIFGRVAGGVEGFSYSNAMVEYGKEWGFQNMYEYLESPRNYVPGTAMSFAGLRKQSDRINIVAYMRSLSDDPVPLPDPLPAMVAPVDDGLELEAPEGLETPSSVDAGADAVEEAVDAAVEAIEEVVEPALTDAG